jgi:hypothetical protein
MLFGFYRQNNVLFLDVETAIEALDIIICYFLFHHFDILSVTFELSLFYSLWYLILWLLNIIHYVSVYIFGYKKMR